MYFALMIYLYLSLLVHFSNNRSDICYVIISFQPKLGFFSIFGDFVFGQFFGSVPVVKQFILLKIATQHVCKKTQKQYYLDK